MACPVNLKPKNTANTDGSWYLTDAPALFDGTLSVSCDNGVYVEVNVGSPPYAAPWTVLDNGCGSPYDIWVDLSGEAHGTYEFTFVSPEGNDPDACGDACSGCVTYTIIFEAAPEQIIAEACAEGPDKNLYILAGLDCNSYDTIEFCSEPYDNELESAFVGICPTKGTFTPANVAPDVYFICFTPNESVCSNCVVIMELTIEEGPYAGNDQEATVCIV